LDNANWKQSTFRLLPASIQSPIVTTLTRYRIAKTNRLKTPSKITFFVTNRCNARCKHCFYSSQIGTNNFAELNLDQIQKLAFSLNHPIDLNLTGGEPFLRNDLVDIGKIFCQTPKVTFLYLPTNGLLPERILSVVEQIMRECKLAGLYVQVSLDGPEEKHDEIRKVKGCFKKAIETIELLKKLQQKYNTLYLKTATVISSANYQHLDEVVQTLLPLKVQHTFMLARGNNFGVYHLPKNLWSNFDPDENGSFVPIEELPSLYSTLNELNQNAGSEFWAKEEQLRLMHSINMVTHRQKIFPCYAGRAEGIIYPNGDVSFCEMTKPFGNLISTDFDLHKLWHSQAANAVRGKIEKCFCTHDCNLSTSMSMHTETILARLNGRDFETLSYKKKFSTSNSNLIL